jgi:hypothetical protein
LNIEKTIPSTTLYQQYNNSGNGRESFLSIVSNAIDH